MECLSEDYRKVLESKGAGAVVGGNISARKVDGNIPTDPLDDFWKEGSFVAFEMDPQMITNPMWPNPSTRWIHVKAARNDKDIAVMVSWIDSTRNDEMIRSEQYKDQAAIMFPVNQRGEEPSFTMGGDGEEVNIWQWKATWETSAGNEGENYYPVPDMDMEKGFAKDVEPYNPGKVSGNIFADSSMRRSPIEDLNAEGFSTLTTQEQQDIDGQGKWLNNRWSVVFKRSLKNNDDGDTQFNTTRTPIAFAIWNGGNKERNGQKAVTQFYILEY
ncbi:MAG: nitrite oxidoreductase, gamma subunit [Candidatus Nitronauta litoralis]|uniref:Nitrite oxidoreductase, gamma subunit n=1 Tax=Candidatus Nitronauta litoralis TaxID=2705533 RepID=A0A7T0G1K6_9BACT|nr:MAG: nitrite oxidoreductase, gamma subunit [Candidatus Nitronauta litoralis]